MHLHDQYGDPLVELKNAFLAGRSHLLRDSADAVSEILMAINGPLALRSCMALLKYNPTKFKCVTLERLVDNLSD